MVKVEVEGKIFDMLDQDVEGSRTIQDVLQQYTQSNELVNEPIKLFIPLYKWRAYMNFLEYSKPYSDSLYVINYLENLEQARNWFYLKYKQGMSKDEILNIINTYTEFVPSDTIPFELTTNITQMLPYLNVKQLPLNYIEHIFNTLFTKEQYHLYQETLNYHELSNVSRKLLTDLKSNKFIVYEPSKRSTYFSSHSILNYGRQTDIIPDRIASYYPDIRVYDVNGKLVTSPNSDTPYLVYTEQQYANVSANISWTDNPTRETFLPVNVYDPNSTYKPRGGYDTGIRVKDEAFFSYNPLSLYNHDYYIFLPYEHDPIAKTTYVFSI
jgi:hypothetical protein